MPSNASVVFGDQFFTATLAYGNNSVAREPIVTRVRPVLSIKTCAPYVLRSFSVSERETFGFDFERKPQKMPSEDVNNDVYDEREIYTSNFNVVYASPIGFRRQSNSENKKYKLNSV